RFPTAPPLPGPSGRRRVSAQSGGNFMDYRRQVTMRRDGDDFVVATHTDGLIIFRNKDADALRKLCRSLRWEIISDTTAPADRSTSSLVPSRARRRGARRSGTEYRLVRGLLTLRASH